MQHVTLLQQLFKKVGICCYIDLTGLRQFSFADELIKAGQCRRVTAHVIIVFHAIYHISIKQYGDPALFHIGIRQVNSGAAAQNKFLFHSILHIIGHITSYASKGYRQHYKLLYSFCASCQ